MNNTSLNYFSIEIDDNDFSIKILAAVIWTFLEFPCNFMLFGFVQFERIGGDPLKRRISDPVGTYNKLSKTKL